MRGTLFDPVSVVYRDVTRQAKGLYRLKHVGAGRSGLAYLSRCNLSWFCHKNTMKAPQSNASQVTASNNARACFNCRDTGHFIANCPYANNKPAALGFSNSVNGPRPALSGANRVPIRSNNIGNNNQQMRPP
jgi:hypothetical protein